MASSAISKTNKQGRVFEGKLRPRAAVDARRGESSVASFISLFNGLSIKIIFSILLSRLRCQHNNTVRQRHGGMKNGTMIGDIYTVAAVEIEKGMKHEMRKYKEGHLLFTLN